MCQADISAHGNVAHNITSALLRCCGATAQQQRGSSAPHNGSEMSADGATPSQSAAPSSAVPSDAELEAETVALVTSGFVGWQVCWSKRMARRYWSRRPTRTHKEVTQWTPPTHPRPTTPAATSAPTSPPSRSLPPNEASADQAHPPPGRAHSSDDFDAPTAKRQRTSDGLPSYLDPSASLKASAVTAFSDQARFDALMSLSRQVIAINVFGSTSPSSLSLYSSRAPLPPPQPRDVIEDNPRVIVARRNAFQACDARLTALVRQHTSLRAPPVNAFQRWGFSQRALSVASADPLLPSNAAVDDALVQELVREGVEEAAALRVAEELATEVRKQGEALGAMRLEYKDRQYAPGSIRVLGEGTASSLRVQMVEGERVVYEIPINAQHWAKLQRLYLLHSPPASSSLCSPASLSTDDVFLHRAFALLARYDTIGGAGYQAAMPEPAFAYLQQQFALTTECFASPLNCCLERYHSAFEDTDGWFGSRGSFFGLRADEGCYESNPPFLELNLATNAVHVLGLLHRAQEAQRALMFVVVWPGWDDTPGYAMLMASAMMRRLLVLGKGAHTYKEGYQHRSAVAYRRSEAKSFVFFMQTDAAAANWPVTEEKVSALLTAFQYTDAPAPGQRGNMGMAQRR